MLRIPLAAARTRSVPRCTLYEGAMELQPWLGRLEVAKILR